MTKHILFPIALAALVIAVFGYLVNSISLGKINIGLTQSTKNQEDYDKYIQINNKRIDIEVADTEEKRLLGLSNRNSLDNDTGMLFIFDTKDTTPIFWMKDMLIPIDIIWINDNKIIKIDENVSPPDEGANENQLKRYFAPIPIDYVLEVNANYTKDNSIKVGDEVDLSNAGI